MLFETLIRALLRHRTGRTGRMRYHRTPDPGSSVAEMARADYDVNEGVKPKGQTSPTGDRSFRGCIAALLAFLLLCIILIVVSAVIKNQRKGHTQAEGGNQQDTYAKSHELSGTETKVNVSEEEVVRQNEQINQAKQEQESNTTITNSLDATVANTTTTTTTTTTTLPKTNNVPITSVTESIATTFSTTTTTPPPKTNNVPITSVTESIASTFSTTTTPPPKTNNVPITSVTESIASTFSTTTTTTTPQPTVNTASVTFTAGSDMTYSSGSSQTPTVNSFSTEQQLTTTSTKQSSQTTASDWVKSIENSSVKNISTVTMASAASHGMSDLYSLYTASTYYSTASTEFEGSGGDMISTETTIDYTYSGSTVDAINDYSTSKDYSSSFASLTSARNISQESEECETDVCYKQAVHMLSMMNHTMDPCDDFYVYACGGLQTNPNLLLPDPEKQISQKIYSVIESASDSSSPSLVKMKNFYQSCMSHNDLVDIQQVFDVLNQIFYYNDTLNSSTIYTDLFTMLLKYNSSPLFDVLIDVEDKTNPHFVFKLVDPQYSSSIFSYDKQSQECNLNVSKSERKNGKPIKMDNTYLEYKTCKKNIDITNKVLEYANNSGYDYLINDGMKGALSELRSLMNLFSDTANIRHGLLSKEYVTMSVKELEINYPLINWLKLFSNLVDNRNIVKETDTVQVYFKSTFDIIFEKLQKYTQSDRYNIVYMNNALHALSAYRMFNDIVTVHNACNRHDYCMNTVKTLMTDIASAAYLSTFTYKELLELKLRATKTFHQLKSTIREQINKATWLDEQSKSTTTDQLDNMSIAADGGMDFYHSFSYVDSIWKNVTIQKDNYLQNALDMVLFRRNLAFSLYGKDPRNLKYIWSHFKYPINLGAHFIYGLNMIIVPTSQLSLESNSIHLPQYIRMASEGFIMAHEIAHTFDFTGIMFGPNGKGDSQLTQYSKSRYKEMQLCYNFQYDFLSSFRAEDGYHIDFKTLSRLSNNERFSDYTGIKLAYDTFIEYFNNETKLPLLVKQTQNQLFFLQAAQEFCSKDLTYDHFVSIYEDEHLPSAIRVKNVMSNTKEFLDVFKCNTRSRMHTDYPCESFPDLKDETSIFNR